MKTNKKVLIVVKGGVTTACVDQGVDVVIIDYDACKANPHETPVVHSSFLPLMEFADEKGLLPVWHHSDDGRINDAHVVPWASPDFIMSFKSFDEELPIVGKPVLCKMGVHTGKNQMILTLTSERVMDTGGLLSRQLFQIKDVKQWAYLPDYDLNEALLQFTGSECWYEHSLQPLMTFTDGVKYFAEKTNSFWLLDIIATEYFVMLKEYPYLVITAESQQKKCDITITDVDGNELKSKHIEFTTLISGTWRFYLTDNVLLLPSEY